MGLMHVRGAVIVRVAPVLFSASVLMSWPTGGVNTRTAAGLAVDVP